MISLIMTIFCSTSIALMIKHNDAHKGNALVLLAGNYLIAAIISLLFLLLTPDAKITMSTFNFGALIAILFVFSFFSFTKAVNVAGTALATVSSRLSVIIPITLSIIIFQEMPTNQQIIGFMLAFVTILFFYQSVSQISNKHLKQSDFLYLFAVLVGIGCADFSMKVFLQWRSVDEKPLFLLSIFTFSFFYTSGYIYLKHIKFEPKTFIRGGILGIPNIFSSYFLLGALAVLPAILVYPIINISIILLTTIGAALIWHEKLNFWGKLALLSGLISIILLGL